MTTSTSTSHTGAAGILFGLALALLACTGVSTGHADTAAPTTAADPTIAAAPTTAAPSTTAPATSDADPLVACEVDADCVVVEMGCCDICNGGFMMSVAKDHKDAAIARFHETDCTGGCTERGCNFLPEPVCDAGVCARTENRVQAADGTPARVLVRNRSDR